MEIFYSGNIGLLIFGVTFWVLITCLGPKAFGPPFEGSKANKIGFWIVTVAFIVVLPVIAYDNAVEHHKKKEKTAAALSLKTALDEVRQLRFDERCSFNGFIVADDWIADDSFPCITLDNVRIWKTSETVGNTKKFSTNEAFQVGVIGGAGKVTKLLDYNLGRGYYFDGRFVPEFKSDMNEGARRLLINIISGASADKPVASPLTE